jgi:hypothetical protein
MGYVFISYARSDRTYADQLKSKLEGLGYSTWLDTNSIDENQDFTGEIDFAIRGASHFIVCLTEDVKNRKDSFVRREVVYALMTDKARSAEHPSRRLPIILYIPAENCQSQYLRGQGFSTINIPMSKVSIPKCDSESSLRLS